MMKDRDLTYKIIFLACVVSLSACLQVFSDVFVYRHANLLDEFWRLWTGHWVHVGWIHFALNIFAFVCLPFIFPRVKVWQFIALLLTLPPLISLSFFYILPNIEAYAGLSGVLHGAYVCIAITHVAYGRDRGFAALVLLFILLKVIWENTFGSQGTAELIGSPVLIEAHLLGVIWGVLLAAVYALYDYFTAD